MSATVSGVGTALPLVQAHADFVRARAATAPWLTKIRMRGMERFAAVGLPTRRHEDWKYTSLRSVAEGGFSVVDAAPDSLNAAEASLQQRLARLVDPADVTLVFIDGVLATSYTRLGSLETGVSVRALADAASAQGDAIGAELLPEPSAWQDHPFAALAQAFLDVGTVVEIERGVKTSATIHLIHVATAADAAVFPRTLLKLSPLAEARVAETFVGATPVRYLVGSRVDIALAEGASLLYARSQLEGDAGIHAGLTYARLARDAKLYSYAQSQGGRLIRNDLAIDLDGEGAEATLDGLYLVRGQEHVDHHTVVDHKVPHTRSAQIYKGVLADRARGVFNGKVIVRQNAQLTDARQLNRNLLLSSEAEIDTKPELQIDANDVKCSHGAAVGQLRSEEIFYLQSRGLTRDAAAATLSAAFADEVALKLPDAGLRQRAVRLTQEWFAR